MKKSKLILSFLFFALLGTILSIAIGLLPIYGLALGFVSFLPISVPKGVFGDNIPNTDDEDKLLEKIDKKINKALRDYSLGMINDEGLSKRLEPIELALKEFSDNNVNVKAFNDVRDSFNKLSEDVAKIQENYSNKYEVKGIKYVLKENAEQLKKLASGEIQKVTLVLKADTLRNSVTNNPQGMLLPDIGQLPEPSFAFSNYFTPFNVSPNSNGVVRYIDWDQATIVRAAATRAEGVTFPESTAKWIGYSLNLEKIGDTIPVSEEILQDVSWAESELRNFLENNVMRVENAQLYNGDGVTPNISGIYTLAPTFDTAAYAASSKAKTTTPDLTDLIKILKKEIMNGKDGKYNVNVVFISHEEYTSTVLKKDTTGRLLRNTLEEVGIDIIPTSFVTNDTLVIGDSRFARLYQAEGYNIEIDRSGTDFVDDMLTMKAKKRMSLLIRQADRDGFLKVTSIAAAITAITA